MILFFLFSCANDPVKESNDSAQEDSSVPDTTVEEPENSYLPDETEEIEEPCETPLVLTPHEAHISTFGNLQFHATGGSDKFTYSTSDNQSGSIIHAEEGYYLAGEIAETIDTVTVTDMDCGDTLEASVHVYTPFSVSPAIAHIPPGTVMTPTTSGGSGDISCSMSVDASAASLNGCIYTAGGDSGLDTLVVTDERTGESFSIDITVDPNATLVLPTLNWAAVVGDPLTFSPSGGTGSYEITVSTGDATVEDLSVSLHSPTITTIQLRDSFADMQLDIQIDPINKRSPSNVTLSAPGDPGEGTVLNIGDHNDDGINDLITTDPDAHYGATSSGAAYVYVSDGNGSIEVEQTLSTDQQYAGYGVSSGIGDFDGDGVSDLAIGAPYADGNEAASGMVHIHYGSLAGFEDESDPLFGYRTDDHHGQSLAVCDFNGDGYDDLAVGVPLSENIGYDPSLDEQGSVLIYLGSASGLPGAETQILWGRLPGTNGLEDTNDLRLGARMTAADFDGDGNCDLVVTAIQYINSTPGNYPDSNGLIFLHYGLSGTAGQGLDADPAAIWTNFNPISVVHHRGDLGDSLSVGDINGDGAPELIASGSRVDLPGEYANHGMVAIGELSTISPTAGTVEEFPAAWMRYGNYGNRQFGLSTTVADVDGDGLDDLLIGESRALGTSGGPGPGGVNVYLAPEILSNWNSGYDATSDSPSSVIANPTNHSMDQFGFAVAVIDDLDADGITDIAIHSSQDDSFGADLGALYISPWDNSHSGTAYEMESLESGQFIGINHSITFSDTDGDGHQELWIGGSGESLGMGSNYGAVWEYTFDGNSIPSTDYSQMLSQHSGQAGDDYYGFVLNSPGDLDQDGYDELIVVSGYASVRGSSYSPSTYIDHGDETGTQCLATGHIDYNKGEINIHRGSANGPEQEPSWIITGISNYQWITSVVSQIDQNGDGDFELAFIEKRRLTRMATLPSAQPGSTHVLCGFQQHYNGQSSTYYRSALTNMGDIDGDGCDELAYSYLGDYVTLGWSTNQNQGSIRILWGWDDNASGSSDPIWANISSILSANNCLACHGSFSTYNGLISSTSSQVSMNLVEPGDLNNSYLWHKLNGTHGSVNGSGVQMPQNSTPLSTTELQTIEDWILAGAPENSTSTGCPTQQEFLRITQTGADSFSGHNMISGKDLDGDGINDLILGEPHHLLGTTEYGGITIVSGADLHGLGRNLVDGDFVRDDAFHTYETFPNTITYNPNVPNTEYGAAIAFLEDGNNLRVAVGAPQALDGIGAVYVMSLNSGAWEVDMILAGESLSPNSEFGSAVTTGHVNGNPTLAIGGRSADGVGVDNGAVFTWTQNGGLQ